MLATAEAPSERLERHPVTNPAPWTQPDGYGYAAPLASRSLPSWARVYRAVLMAIGGIFLLALIVITISFSLPVDMYDRGKLQALDVGIMLSLFYGAGSIPYLIANIVYAIRWAVSLRGRGYRATGISSVFLVAAPILVALTVLRGVALLWWH